MSFFQNTIYNKALSAVKDAFPGLIYVNKESKLHSMHPLVKLTMLLCFSLSVFAVPSWLGGVILLGVVLVAYRLAGLSPAFFYRKLRFILFFGLFILIVQILAVKEGLLMWQFSLGSISLSIWSEGLLGGLSMMLRFINIISSSYLFIATTDPNRLAYSLMQAGLPYRFGFMLITALRFIPVFQQELEQVKNAQMAKGIDMEGLSPRKLLRAVRYLLIPLVISALSKVDFLSNSMEGRAFGLYNERSYMYTQAWSKSDRITVVLVPIAFLIFYLVLG
jgi:energy-coupling factor transport system permease protein